MRWSLIFVMLCAGCTEQVAERRSLEAYPNPFGSDDPLWSPQPHRDKPLEVVVSKQGDRAFVSLQGTPDAPGRHVAVVDIASGSLITRIEVGSGATGLALHPGGRFLLVLNRFSNFASLIDTVDLEVVASPPVDFYSTEAVFSASGDEVYITNRWRDTVGFWRVTPMPGKLGFQRQAVVPVGVNPRDIAISDDGETLAVAALTGMTVSLVDVASRTERTRIAVGAPANGLAFAGDYLLVATLSASTHHRPLAGPDTDQDGQPGDGTPNVNFQDLQNEIAVYHAATGQPAHRYTSDTICCKDYRDVNPDDVDRSGDLLPPRKDWIVKGALPEQITVAGSAVYVTFSGSNQVQRFSVDGGGALEAGPVWSTAGHNPHGIAVTGDRVVVVHRLSETLGIYEASTGALQHDVVVGDVSGAAFPATDAEIGELFNFVTAPFTVDGDGSCTHCHREDGNIDKAFSMPLTRYAGLGSRMTMAYRGAADTRPWFFESAMDETNFKPVINELARIENFCCSDYTLWPDGAPADCETNPPPECDALNTSSADGFGAVRDSTRAPFQSARPTQYASRDLFFEATAKTVVGRERSFGDGLYLEDPITGARESIALDFGGLTRALGLFLLTSPRLLPNPNNVDTASSRRGRALFESPATGCAACHPAPAFALSSDVNPMDVPLRMGPVVSPVRADNGTNLDLFARGFVATFPLARDESCEDVCGAPMCEASPNACDELRNVSFGVPSLRGLWDRAPSMLHDGRAKGLREVLCTPGHPALAEGETGYNERDGVFDTHGGTSHLSPADIEDLITYLLTL